MIRVDRSLRQYCENNIVRSDRQVALDTTFTGSDSRVFKRDCQGEDTHIFFENGTIDTIITHLSESAQSVCNMIRT